MPNTFYLAKIICLFIGISTFSNSILIEGQKKSLGFDNPPRLYSGIPNNQVVSIDFSAYVPVPNADAVCFVVWTTVGGNTTGGVFWVKL